MNATKVYLSRFIIHNFVPLNSNCFTRIHRHRRLRTVAFSESPEVENEKMVVVGGGAAGIYGAIRAKTLAPNLNVIVIEKAKPLSKVKISGGGRCNVTNGHYVDNMILVEKYPRGSKEFRGSFFNVHGPGDTMSWFSDHGVKLKVLNVDGITGGFNVQNAWSGGYIAGTSIGNMAATSGSATLKKQSI